MSGDIILDGLQVPEGPAMLPDGRVVFTEQTRGAISIYDGHGHQELAVTGGSPNSTVVGSDGALYVCQNGGVVGAWRSPDPRTPSIQRVDASGTVQTLAESVAGVALAAPNDLVFGADGRLFFTDPAQPFDPADRRDTGVIFALGADGGDLVRHVGPVYCNGIAFDTEGGMIWVESYTRRVVALGPGDGRDRVLATLAEGHIPDGIAVAEDGRIFIASCGSHGIDVVGPDGSDAGFLHLDERAFPSNLCFDGSALWVTDFGVDHPSRPETGRLWRVDTDAVGLAVHHGALPEHPLPNPSTEPTPAR